MRLPIVPSTPHKMQIPNRPTQFFGAHSPLPREGVRQARAEAGYLSLTEASWPITAAMILSMTGNPHARQLIAIAVCCGLADAASAFDEMTK